MKQIRLFIVTLFVTVLPMKLLGGTITKEINSSFTGNVYGIATGRWRKRFSYHSND